MKRQPLYASVRITPETKKTIEEYAESRGLTFIRALDQIVDASPKIRRFLWKKGLGK